MIKFVWIIGNLGVGKTTLCNNLKREFHKKWKFYNIDEIRFEKNKEKSGLIEIEIRSDFIRQMEEIKPFSVLESVGTYGRIAMDNFKMEEVLIIKLNAHHDQIMGRLENRLNDPSKIVPFPGIVQNRESYESSLSKFEGLMNRVIPKYIIETDNKNPEQVFQETLLILKKELVIK